MMMMKTGWIGTGVMGASMAGHLQKAGHDMNVFTRSKKRAQALLDNGATWYDSPAEVAANSEIVFSIVGHPEDVQDIFMGKTGILNPAATCRIIVDMTTSQPSLARIIYEEAAKLGIESLDAPVSGGDVGAREAKLAIMVGGKKDVYETVLPLFEIMGKNISYMGNAGSGQHTKMANQILVAGTMIGVCEALLYAHRQGLDMQQVIDIVETGAAGSWSVSNLGPRIVKGNFEPGFFVEHFIKDMGIALKEAEEIGLSLPGLALVQQLYLAVKAQGHGRSGTHALFLALESLNGGASPHSK
jgi:3-hydroxyisobutyrate dehydrogenase